jgi:two-component system phosphate regulon sensor histidine kinase PhoR
MIREKRQLILATIAMVAIFASYEAVKWLLFPNLSLLASHFITTIMVGLITFLTARHIIKQQTQQLREREAINEQLRQSLDTARHHSQLLRSILASVDEGLVITDRHFRVLLTNDAARRLFGLNKETISRLAEISRDPQLHRAFAQALQTREPVEARIEFWTGHDKRVLHLHAAPLKLGGTQVDGVVGAFLDITKLERLERVRQEFLINVSHELRTPLASITAYVETLLNGGLEDEENRLRFLTTIQRNAERMRNLVNDISELSAIESGAVNLSLEQVPLSQIVDEVFTELRPRCEKQQVCLRNEVAADCQVTADRHRLAQILINLVDNAIKFNRPHGEVILSAEPAEDGNYLLIKVRDTGIGIPAEHLPRVFERFYRVDKARSREQGGTGLGLSIVKHLARAHGGEAYVSSRVGTGSEFIIRLPHRAQQAAAKTIAAEAYQSSTAL